jgi:cystathionine gamma-synthase
MSSDAPSGFDAAADGTRAVHAGEARKKAYDAITVPIVASATYVFDDTKELTAHHEGQIEREEYGRYGNPTVRAAERKIAALDGAEDCALFGSGMSAISTALFAMLKTGQHLVLTSDCYRRTRQFVSAVLGKLGIESTLVEPGDYDGLERAIIPNKTRVILSESPTNPYLRIADLARLAELKKKATGLKLFIDSTFATPINQRPLELGADLVFHSCTKYFGGHNDLLAGAVSGRAPFIAAIRELRGILGGVLDPHSAYLLIRGIKTLKLRVDQQNESALAIARFLERHPRIERVFYPGLESHPDHAIARDQMRAFGGVISFQVKGTLERRRRNLDRATGTDVLFRNDLRRTRRSRDPRQPRPPLRRHRRHGRPDRRSLARARSTVNRALRGSGTDFGQRELRGGELCAGEGYVADVPGRAGACERARVLVRGDACVVEDDADRGVGGADRAVVEVVHVDRVGAG